jgi:hypothetical protein
MECGSDETVSKLDLEQAFSPFYLLQFSSWGEGMMPQIKTKGCRPAPKFTQTAITCLSFVWI